MKYVLLLITALSLAACSESDKPVRSVEVYEFYPDGKVKSIGNYKDGKHPNNDPGFQILETYQADEIVHAFDSLQLRSMLYPGYPNLLGFAGNKVKAAIDDRLKDWPAKDAGFRFLWGMHPEDIGGQERYALYAVRIPGKHDLSIIGSDVSRTQISKENGQILLDIVLLPEAAERFRRMTTDNINRSLAIVVSGRVISAPTVMGAISDGNIQISGAFTMEEAEEMKSIMDSHILNGEWRSYHPNGKLKEIRNYRNGERTGSWSTYDNDGHLIRKFEK